MLNVLMFYLSFVITIPIKIGKNCGVMKFLADMPPCLGGEDNRINVA